MGIFDKMFSGLTKTRNNMEELEELFREFKPDSDDFYDDLEELLIMSDCGAATAEKVVYEMKKMTWERRFRKGYEAKEGLCEILAKMLEVGESRIKTDTVPSVILMVGVNGVGKTTTIGKLASQYVKDGKKVLLCAGDTFRAAAAEQLTVWAERAGADIIKHNEGSDPASVVFDGINAARARQSDIVMTRIVERELPESDVEILMVLDATTGQNGLNQAKQFLDFAGITGIVLTKLDGTAKGGVVFGIANELNVPVKLVGVGEQIDDLIPFDAQSYVQALFKE